MVQSYRYIRDWLSVHRHTSRLTSKSWFLTDRRELPPKPVSPSFHLPGSHPSSNTGLLCTHITVPFHHRKTQTRHYRYRSNWYCSTLVEESKSETLEYIWLIIGFCVSFPKCWQFECFARSCNAPILCTVPHRIHLKAPQANKSICYQKILSYLFGA